MWELCCSETHVFEDQMDGLRMYLFKCMNIEHILRLEKTRSVANTIFQALLFIGLFPNVILT